MVPSDEDERMRANKTAMIGIDVGATKIAAALVSSSGQVLETRRLATHPEQGVEAVIRRLSGLANELLEIGEEHPLGPIPPLAGIGIGIPGQVNAKEGTVREAVNLGWGEVKLVEEMMGRLAKELPMRIDTDTNASTLGEFHFGVARGCSNFVYLSIGSGLGAGIFVDGRLVRGTTWKAAELGHISLDPEGPACKCGQRGCAETFVSGPGLIKLAEGFKQGGEQGSHLSGPEALSADKIIAAARAGDKAARAATGEMGRRLGTVMAIAVSVTNPAMVIIGGGLGLAAYDLLAPTAAKALSRRVLPSLYGHLEILPAGLAHSAIGAASLVLEDA